MPAFYRFAAHATTSGPLSLMAQRAPFVSLWSRDDVRTAVCDFLPTKAIAVLPVVAKPLRAVQTSLLVTAIRRRGKTTVPTPHTTRALLDALLVKIRRLTPRTESTRAFTMM